MKKLFYTCAFTAIMSLLCAQTDNKPVKVRIKKIENINGVETITDTTFVTNAPESLKFNDKNIQVIRSGGTNGKVMIIDTQSDSAKSYSFVHSNESIDKEIEQILKEAGIEPEGKTMKKVVIVQDGNNRAVAGTAQNKSMKVVIVRTDVSEASSPEMKKAGIPESREKLKIEDLTCTPNPTSGSFNIQFSSPDKSEANVVIRDVNGKTVHSESVKDFSGKHKIEFNPAGKAGGIYFVTVTQGNKSATRKLVVE